MHFLVTGNLLSYLQNENRRLILFGGKGGSGKTTSACATGLRLAQLDKKKKILIISTDPAHSVGDSFNMKVGNSITPIKGVDNLWALEMKAEEESEEFKEKYGAAIKKIADRGTYFDKEDIEDFFSLTIPGLDEIMAIIKIASILRDGQYHLIILDTAPTGHTLRLLSLPRAMEKWIDLMELMQSKHRFLVKSFTGRYKRDNADEFLKTMYSDIGGVKRLLSSESTEFIPVTIPEPLSIDETQRLVRQLGHYRIPANNIIINRVASVNESCSFCTSRKKDQKDRLDQIKEKFSGCNLYKVPLFPYEIHGLDRLQEYAEVLSRGRYQFKVPHWIFSLRKPSWVSQSRTEELLKKNLKFMIFGGKGGVGKTCISAATALRITRMHPEKKVLIFSTDPAHSLSDVFDYPIGDKLTLMKETGNLYGLEIDAPKLYEEWRDDHRKDIEKMFDKFLGRGVDIKFDREIMEDLISTPLPGLDEIMALGEITDFVRKGKFDVYILDSAATGHLIRFLEMPNLFREWLKTIFRIILKYKGVVRLNKLAQQMIEESKKVRKVQKMLTDSKNTEFVVITIPEEMAVAETDRLLTSLKRLKIPCEHIVVNMVVPATRCGFCSLRRKEQQKYINEFNNEFKRLKYSNYQVSKLPLFPQKVKGIEDLIELSVRLYG